MKVLVAVAFSAVVTFASAIELVLHRHESRKLFVELQALRKVEHELNQEWGQLLLEQATSGHNAAIEETARTALNMLVPEASRIVELR